MSPIKPWCNWWADPSAPRYQALQRFAPDVVLIEAGINEAFDRKLDSWGNWEKPGNAQFDDFMRSDYQSLVSAMRNLGAKVVVANTPCADWPSYLPSIT